jgi:hypothetical protein
MLLVFIGLPAPLLAALDLSSRNLTLAENASSYSLSFIGDLAGDLLANDVLLLLQSPLVAKLLLDLPIFTPTPLDDILRLFPLFNLIPFFLGLVVASIFCLSLSSYFF